MRKQFLNDKEKQQRWLELVQSLNPDIDPNAFRLVNEMRALGHTLSQVGESSVAETGLSYAQYRVLLNLFFARQVAECPELNPSEISANLGVSRNTISSLIRSLEDDQLIKRQLDKKDRRKFNISLTETGTELVTQYAGRHMRMIANCFSALNSEEQAQLTHILNKLRENILSSHAAQNNQLDKQKSP